MATRSFIAPFLLLICSFCASSQEPTPTPEHPLAMCRIVCPARNGPNRMLFQHQHLCSSGTVWFEDFEAMGSVTVRGADGEILSEAWTAGETYFERGSIVPLWRILGHFPKSEVELGQCSTVIARRIQSRASEDRGQHPGEDPQGNPSPPKN